MNANSDNIKVKGHVGRWHVIDTKMYGDVEFFLLEHSTYGDDAASVIVDKEGSIALSGVNNGWDDFDEFLDS